VLERANINYPPQTSSSSMTAAAAAVGVVHANVGQKLVKRN
jgi:hypothetical protein